jgi:hypothetical protein
MKSVDCERKLTLITNSPINSGNILLRHKSGQKCGKVIAPSAVAFASGGVHRYSAIELLPSRLSLVYRFPYPSGEYHLEPTPSMKPLQHRFGFAFNGRQGARRFHHYL